MSTTQHCFSYSFTYFFLNLGVTRDFEITAPIRVSFGLTIIFNVSLTSEGIGERVSNYIFAIVDAVDFR